MISAADAANATEQLQNYMCTIGYFFGGRVNLGLTGGRYAPRRPICQRHNPLFACTLRPVAESGNVYGPYSSIKHRDP